MTTSESGQEYPGIGRLHYFLAHLSLFVAVVFVLMIFGPDRRAFELTSLLVMVVALVLDVLRLRNIGVSQWFVFLKFLPLGSTLLAIGLLAAQTGWAETRRLDKPGRRILAVELILLAIMLYLIFRAGAATFGLGESVIGF